MQKVTEQRLPDALCEECGLWQTCQSPLMEGSGSENPEIVFIGEAPGADEDEQNQAFVGQAGRLLRQTINAVGIPENICRFTNAVRCRPPGNEIKEHPRAVDLCRFRILRELHVYKPKVVVLLGNTPLQTFTWKKTGITELSGKVWHEHGRTYVASIHPSFALRSVSQVAVLRYALEQAAAALGIKKKPRVVAGGKEKFVYVRDKRMLYEWVDLLKNCETKLNTPFLSTDIEASSLSPFVIGRTPQVGCIGWAWSISEAVLFPVHSRVGFNCTVPPQEVLEGAREVWQSDVRHSLHHGKMDSLYVQVTDKFNLGNGFAIKRYWFDTGLGSYVLDERPGFHGLDVWATRMNRSPYWMEMYEYHKNHPESDPNKGGNINLTPARLLYPYNLNDTTTGYEATVLQYEMLREQGLYDRPFRFPLMSHHNNMAMALHQNGLGVDLEANDRLLKEFPEKVKGFEEEIRGYGEYRELEKRIKLKLVRKFTEEVRAQKSIQAAIEREGPEAVKNLIREKVIAKAKKQWEKDGGVNLNADAALRILIYDILEVEVTKTTKKTKVPSVDKKTLEEIINQNDFPILHTIGQRNKYSSAYSKYIEPIRSWTGSDGRSHSNWLVHGQVTGRVSSEDPNQENLPKHDPVMAPQLRCQFRSREEGYVMVEADFSQNEMRLYADRAKDEVMIQEFLEGKDLHKMGAVAGFEKPEEEISADERQKAKSMVSFGILYLRKAKSLARDMKQSVPWAEKFIQRYFSKYKGCYNYSRQVIKQVQQDLQVASYFNRIRRLPEAASTDEGIQEHAFRQAVNSPIQGDSSDLAWVAAWRLEEWLRANNMKTRVVVVIHDAIVCDVYIPEFEQVWQKLEAFMCDRDYIKKMTGWYCSVPLVVEMTAGVNMAPFVDPNAKSEKDRGIYIPGCMKKLKKKDGMLYLPEDIAA